MRVPWPAPAPYLGDEMNPRRTALRITAAATVFAAVFASAATLGGLRAKDLGAGAARVGSCDTDGVSATYTTSGSNVTAVTVSGIAPACATGRLSLVVTGAGQAQLARGGPVTVSATSHTVTLSSPVPSASVTGLHVVITGP